MNNITKIMAAVKSRGYGALMITSRVGRLFAAGFDSSAGVVLVTDNKAWFLTDSRYDEAARAAITSAEVLLVTKDKPYHKQINAALSEWDIAVVGFEEDSVTYSEYLGWKDKLSAELAASEKLLSEMRAVKSERDLECMIRAQKIAEKSFQDILPLVTAGLSEKELAAELICSMYKNGAEDKAFDPIVVSGERTSLPHGVPSDRKIGKGFLTIDFGARAGGWCSDTTRTLCVGNPTEEMTRVYDTVLRAQQAGISMAKAGVSGKDIDGAARSVIEKAGYGEYFGHGFGHGLGLEVHELPNASPLSENEIREGCVISAEPGIYLPGRFGVRIEDVIYITKNGCINITNLSKKLICL